MSDFSKARRVRPWQRIASQAVADYRIFRLRMDRCVSPRTAAAHDFVVLEGADWVNVVAITADAQVVLIEQYRFGRGEVTLEIPGGMIDAGENPVAAAERELREETGYTAAKFTLLGHVDPNPALQSNRCYTVLAENAVPAEAQALDDMEDIAVVLKPLAAVPRLLGEGAIRHALVWAAFMQYDLHRQNK